VKVHGRACGPMCSVMEQLLIGSHKRSIRGNRAAGTTVRVIAKNLVGGAATVRAQSKAWALAEVEQRMNPNLNARWLPKVSQRVKFLETGKEPDIFMPDLEADHSQSIKAALRRDDGAGLGQGRKHKK
jgi:hypothetical protein